MESSRGRSSYRHPCATCSAATRRVATSLLPLKASQSSRNRMFVEPAWKSILAALAITLTAASASAAPESNSQDHQDKDYQRKVRAQLDAVDTQTRRGPFHADWNSLSGYRAPEWFRDAKFGIFIHWGVY